MPAPLAVPLVQSPPLKKVKVTVPAGVAVPALTVALSCTVVPAGTGAITGVSLVEVWISVTTSGVTLQVPVMLTVGSDPERKNTLAALKSVEGFAPVVQTRVASSASGYRQKPGREDQGRRGAKLGRSGRLGVHRKQGTLPPENCAPRPSLSEDKKGLLHTWAGGHGEPTTVSTSDATTPAFGQGGVPAVVRAGSEKRG